MIKIGDFSRLSKVTVRMLRHYDDLGLLKPATVDKFTGYRYYSASQLTRLNRILVLKDLGLSLEQIVLLLDRDLPPEQIRGMLWLKQLELHQALEDGQARLGRIEAWLHQFDEEASMPAYSVILKKVEPIQVAEVREVAPSMAQIGPVFNRLFDQVCEYIYQQGGKIAGPGIVLYYDEEFKENNVHVGAAMVIEGALQGNEEILVHELPAMEQMASTIHQGSFTTIGEAYNAVSKWIEANGYRIAGPAREVYLEYERSGDQAKYVTEVQFPVTNS